MRSCMPPDPDTRTPDYVAPAGGCDAHCHVFGPGEVFPYAPTRKYTPPDAPKENLMSLHDKLGIDRAVIVQASCHGTDNSAMLDAIASSNGAWRGVGMVGALIGGLIFRLFGIWPGLDSIAISLRDIVAAFIGSLIFLLILWVVRTVRSNPS